jgi:hypothetical protein
LDSASPERDEPPLRAPRFSRAIPPVLPEAIVQTAAPVHLDSRMAQLPVTIVTRVGPRRTPLRLLARTLVAPLWAAVAVVALGIDALFVMALLGVQL